MRQQKQQMRNRTGTNLTALGWRSIAIAAGALLSTAVVTGVVVAHYASGPGGNMDGAQGVPAPQAAADPQAPQPQIEPPQALPVPAAPPAAVPPPPPAKGAAIASNGPVHHARAKPSQADVDDCNRYASAADDKATETLKDALVGGAAGAGLGAAGGAIAGGGHGAGKGAGIGALVGATAGTMFGLSNSHASDAHARAAYRACMRRRGYVD